MKKQPQEELSEQLYDRLRKAEIAIMKIWVDKPDEITMQEAGFKAAGLKQCGRISKGEYFLYGAIESICGMLASGRH